MNTHDRLIAPEEQDLVRELSTSLHDITPSITGIGVFFDGSSEPDRFRTITPVILHHVYDEKHNPELFTHEDTHIRHRRLAAGRTTLRLATHKLHHISQPSVMNSDHTVMAHVHELPRQHRVIFQAASDRRVTRPEKIDDRAIGYQFNKMQAKLATLADRLYEMSLIDPQLESLAKADHAPTTPNAIFYQFDITNSRGLSDRQRRSLLRELDQFEQLSLGDNLRRIQDSGDSRIYSRFFTDEEVLTQNIADITRSSVTPYACNLHKWYQDQTFFDPIKHPLRSVIFPGWADRMGDTFTSSSFWGANDILEAESRNISTLHVTSRIPEPRNTVA